MMRKQRSIVSLAILSALLLSLLAWGWADAHAELVRSAPAAGENLAQSPAGVEIYMTEAVEPKLSEISVYNSAGQQVDHHDTRLDPADNTHLLVTLPPLPSGIYTVYWKTASADDGHPTGGAFNFAVGLPANTTISTPASTASTTDLTLSPAEALSKGLLYLATALLAGGVFFFLFVWRPAFITARIPASPIMFRTIWIVALVLAALATLAAIVAEGSLLGIDFMTMLLSTRAGLVALARFAVLLALAGLLVPPENRWNRWAALPLSLLLLLTISLFSHAAAQLPDALPVTLDLIHLSAASAWAGGLCFFMGALLWLRTRPSDTGRKASLVVLVLTRFSTLAMVSVGILILTGVYQTVLEVGSWQALLNTVYGQALLVKLALAFGMVFLGGLNHFVHRPRLERVSAEGNEAVQKMGLTLFRMSLGLEVFLSAVLLLWVGLFTSLPPSQPATPEIIRTVQAADGQMDLRLSISPGRAGPNTFTLQVNPTNAAAADVSGASLVIFPSNTSLPPNDLDLEASGSQTYSSESYALGYPDTWQIRIVVHRSNHLDAHADVYIDLRPQPGISQDTALVLLAGCVALALLFAIWAIVRGSKNQQMAAAR